MAGRAEVVRSAAARYSRRPSREPGSRRGSILRSVMTLIAAVPGASHRQNRGGGLALARALLPMLLGLSLLASAASAGAPAPTSGPRIHPAPTRGVVRAAPRTPSPCPARRPRHGSHSARTAGMKLRRGRLESPGWRWHPLAVTTPDVERPVPSSADLELQKTLADLRGAVSRKAARAPPGFETPRYLLASRPLASPGGASSPTRAPLALPLPLVPHAAPLSPAAARRAPGLAAPTSRGVRPRVVT